MEKIKIEVEVSKEAHEVGVALLGVLKAVKLALADGFQVGQDLPVLITAAISELPKAIEGVDKLPEEAKQDTVAFIKALTLPVADMVEVLLVPKA